MPTCLKRRCRAAGALATRRERRHTLGQAGVAFTGAGIGPVGRSREVGRGVEIVAQCCTEGRLVALLHGDLVEGRRPQVAGFGGEQFGQRPGFGFQLLRLALGLVERLPQADFGVAGSREFLTGDNHRLFGLMHRVFGDRHVFAQEIDRRPIVGGARKRRDIALDSLLLGSEPRGALHFVANRALQGGAAGIEVGRLRLESAQRRLGLVQLGFDDAKPLFAMGAGIVRARRSSARSRRPRFAGARSSPARRCAERSRGRGRD